MTKTHKGDITIRNKEDALSLAMAAGYALSYLETHDPNYWDEHGEALQAIALGCGLKHGQR